MFTLIKNQGVRQFMATEAPAGILSGIIAELSYKFHSFTLECLAFLGTWFITSFVLNTVVDWLSAARHRSAAG